MPQFKVEYRDGPDGAILKSAYFTASDVEEAEKEAKREFTAVQVNLGARQYEILGDEGRVVAAHSNPD
jgi:hypothetical protein